MCWQWHSTEKHTQNICTFAHDENDNGAADGLQNRWRRLGALTTPWNRGNVSRKPSNVHWLFVTFGKTRTLSGVLVCVFFIFDVWRAHYYINSLGSATRQRFFFVVGCKEMMTGWCVWLCTRSFAG